MNSLPSHTVLITARRAGLDAAATLAAVRRQTDAPVWLAGQVSPIAGVPTFSADNPARARNAALHALPPTCAIVCLIDAGCLPADDWLAQLLAPFSADQERNDPVVGVKGAYATRQSAPVARFVQVEYEEKYARLRRQPTIDFVDTYSAAYRRDVLLHNDGFDERFPFLEDQELSFRLAARGYRLLFAPRAVVFNQHPASVRAYAANKFAIGYWKAQVVRRFPSHGLADSHTPQSLRLQVLLAGLTALALPLARLCRPLRPLLALFPALLIGSSLPFARHTRRRDPALAPIAPLLLLVRALALGLGFAWGTLRPAPHIANTATTIGGLNWLLKGLLDFAGGLVGCLLLLILLPSIALAIRLDSPGPIFFRQERIGRGGQPFTVWKFRSMRRNAEAELESLVDVAALRHNPAFKLADDPRITRVGRQLRRWSLDELPQFWNVLKGEMSLVGPRPEETRIVALYGAWHRRRLAVKPGLTGPMQVQGRGDLPLDQRVQLEIAYIENYTLWRDVQILWQTFPAVWSGRGAR